MTTLIIRDIHEVFHAGLNQTFPEFGQEFRTAKGRALVEKVIRQKCMTCQAGIINLSNYQISSLFKGSGATNSDSKV